MTDNILIIPWHRDQEVVKLLNLMLTDLGYTPIVLDKFMPEVQPSDIESACLLHQSKVLITHFEYVDRQNESNFCKMIRDSQAIKNIGLLFLTSRPPEESIYWLPMKDPCFPDQSITIPFTAEELHEKLQKIMNKTCTI